MQHAVQKTVGEVVRLLRQQPVTRGDIFDLQIPNFPPQ
jgi:hypothetical protein